MSLSKEQEILEMLRKYKMSKRRVQKKIVASFEKMDLQDLVPVLIIELANKNESIRESAARFIGYFGEKTLHYGSIPALKKAYETENDEWVRSECTESLGKMGDKSLEIGVLKFLIEILEKDKDYYVRCSAANALGFLGESAIEMGSVSALINTMRKDEDYSVVNSTAFALGRLGVKAADAVPVLIERLNDYKTYLSCIWALGKMGEKAIVAIPNLKRILEASIYKREKMAREFIVIALESIGTKLGYSNYKELLRAYMTEEERRDELIRDYMDQLDSLILQKRKIAIYKLGELKATEAIEHLEKILRKKRENIWLRAFAVWALGEIGTDKAVRILRIIEKPKALVEYIVKGSLHKLDDEYRRKITSEEKKKIAEYEKELEEEVKKVILSPPRDSWFARRGKVLFTTAITELFALIVVVLGLIFK